MIIPQRCVFTIKLFIPLATKQRMKLSRICEFSDDNGNHNLLQECRYAARRQPQQPPAAWVEGRSCGLAARSPACSARSAMRPFSAQPSRRRNTHFVVKTLMTPSTRALTAGLYKLTHDWRRAKKKPFFSRLLHLSFSLSHSLYSFSLLLSIISYLSLSLSFFSISIFISSFPSKSPCLYFFLSTLSVCLTRSTHFDLFSYPLFLSHPLRLGRSDEVVFCGGRTARSQCPEGYECLRAKGIQGRSELLKLLHKVESRWSCRSVCCSLAPVCPEGRPALIEGAREIKRFVLLQRCMHDLNSDAADRSGCGTGWQKTFSTSIEISMTIYECQLIDQGQIYRLYNHKSGPH